MSTAEADRVLATAAACTSSRSAEADPILWVGEGRAAAMKLNGVLVTLEARSTPQEEARTFVTAGTRVALRQLKGEADWRQHAELVFELDEGLRVGYRSFYACGGG